MPSWDGCMALAGSASAGSTGRAAVQRLNIVLYLNHPFLDLDQQNGPACRRKKSPAWPGCWTGAKPYLGLRPVTS